MTKETKTYAHKKGAKAAAEKQGIQNAEFKQGAEGRWIIVVPEATSALYDASLRVRSEVKNPVKLVWDLCFNNKDAKRKDIVDKAIALGVSSNTARTQYQYWRKAEGLVRSPKLI